MSDTTPGSTFNIFEDSKAVIEDNSSELVYFFRYNVVSDEGDVVTEWSTINQLNKNNIVDVLDGFQSTYSISSVESGGVGINTKWTVPDSFIIKQLDIYFAWSWDSNPLTAVFTDFEYTDTVTSNNYYIDIPKNESNVKAKFVKVTVQVPTNIKAVNTNARLFLSTATSTLPVLDAGTIV